MAPKENTIEDFWQMIVENNVQLVIMLCPDIENGKEMSSRYYTNKENNSDSFNYGDYTITMKSCTEKYPGLFIRKLLVSRKGGEQKKVTHIQETMWEDNTSPDKN
jgi:protein-tyrosine phosphatase